MLLSKTWGALRPQERTTAIIAGIIVVITGSILAWQVVQKNTIAVPAAGGTYREAVIGQPLYANPVLAESFPDKAIVRLLFAALPDLTEKIEASADRKTWRIRIKEGLVWSDGAEITSDDIIFTVQKLQDPASGAAQYAEWQGVIAERVSKLEMQFNLAVPYAFFHDSLEQLFPIPKHIFADVPVANWRLSEYNLKPVGSGPYQFAGYDTRTDGFITEYRVEAQKIWAGKSPLVATIALAFFTDPKDAVKAFNAGKVDGINNVAIIDGVSVLRRNIRQNFSLPNSYAVFLNQSTNQALQDIAVRRALSLAIDRVALTQRALEGTGNPIADPTGTAIIPAQAIDEARALLDAAGWITQGDGTRTKKTKQGTIKLVVDITVPDVAFLQQTATLLQEQWKAIGVQTNIITQDPDEVIEISIRNRTYQALLFGNMPNPKEDLYAFWHSSQRFFPGLNLSLYKNKEADTLLEHIRNEPNESVRTELLKKLGANIETNMPAIFLYEPTYGVLTTRTTHFGDHTNIREPADRFSSANEWFVQTNRVLKKQ